MADHQFNCDVCNQIMQCRDQTHPRMICELESCFVVLGPHQYFPGYCVLLCKEPATELDELLPLFYRQYMDDLVKVAAGIRRVIRPHKLNYESLGNVCHHLHWHIFPRSLTEPQPDLPVWNCTPEGEELTPYAFEFYKHSELIQKLRAAITG